MMLKVAKLGIVIAAIVASIVPAAFAGVPDPNNSFYFPEAITNSGVLVDGNGLPSAGPAVGEPVSSPNNAIFYFKACPNNHGGGPNAAFGFLTNNARIKIVVRDQQNNPIAGVAAADICILLNGGTVAQGFSGAGGDSTIANSSLPSTDGTPALVFPLCPNVRCIQADAPTNAAGLTWITLTGSTPGSPGVGTRDKDRKWGHYDGDLPVYVLGFPILGRKSQGDTPGSFKLAIRNLDLAGGLTADLGGLDPAELVNSDDAFNQIGGAYNFFADFDADGTKSGDIFAIIAHGGHDCDSPYPF